MTSVGIRQLKAHLSHYVRLAKQGERIVITERGREVAELRRIAPENEGLRSLIDSGMVRWSGGKPPLPRQRTIRGGPISDTVIENRR